MELNQFRKDFLEEIKAEASANNNSKAEMFVEKFCDNLVETDVISDYEQCFIKTEGKYKRILQMDAYKYEPIDKTLTIITAMYDDEEEASILTKKQATKNFERMEFLVDEILDGKLLKKYDISSSQYDFVNETYEIRNDIKKLELIIITDSIMNDNQGRFASKTFKNMNVDYNVWDISRLYKVFSSKNVKEELEIDFKEYSNEGIPILLANNINENCRSYLGVISGTLLADIYDKFGSRLLEGNVRSFLSTKGAINKNIRASIKQCPEMFFAYNNGISVTATEIETENSEKGIFLVKAKDFQIVNGGQTTASLSNSRFKDKSDLDNIYVQMKLTEVLSEDAETIIPNISRSSNSQNKVNEADFFSTSPFHVRMEKLSRRLYAPATNGSQYDTLWFYERARGQYVQAQLKMTKAEKKKFTNQNPKSQVLTKTDFAKYVNSWERLPYAVSKGAQTNFLKFANEINPKWDENDEIFNENYFKKVVSLAILFKHVEKLVSNQDWYQNAYRANIVTYSIALFSEKLKKQYKDKAFDFSKIWTKQSIPNEISKIFNVLTREVFESITAPGKATMNVTQWCKKEICWDTIKKINVTIDTSVEAFLIDKYENKKIIIDSKKEQKLENEIEYQVKVVDLGEVYWQKVLEFGRSKGLLTMEDTKVLHVVSKIRSSSVPNFVQCKKLLNLVDRLKAEGFK